MFTYTPLRRDTLEIRLVRILSAGESTCDISLELRHALIDEIDFAALSYVWGDVKDPIEISINGSSCMIGHNLFTALRQLSDNGIQDWLWIDALCIQQSDKDEKSYQVQQMRTIFRQAERVFSWLGPGTSTTDKAMEFASRIGPRASVIATDLVFAVHPSPFYFPRKELRSYINHDDKLFKAEIFPNHDAKKRDLAMFIYDILSGPDLNSYTCGKGEGGNDLVAGIQDIMKREYWQRIWINQEIALAKEVTLMCGTKSVGLDHFEATFSAVDECNRLHRYVNSEAWGFAKGPPLYAASDPRDLIFGLLGIITDNDVLKLQVDYRETTAEVFTATTRALISRGDNDNGMSAYRFDFCIPREGNTGNSLPSWVPDWKKIGQVGYEPLMRPGGMYATEIFDATGSIPIPTLPRDTNDDSLGIIRRAGCRVDIVTDVLQPHRSFSDGYTENIEEWLSRIMSFFGLGPVTSPGEDYLWRTILSQEQYSNVNPSIREDNAALVRMIMRGCNINVKLLTTAQKEFLDRFEDPIVKEESFAPEWDWFVYVTQVIKMLQETGATLEYTLFKTMKGMLGLDYLTIKPGDVVTLLWGLPSPIILRQQNDQNFDGLTFQGCAYVDQIMHGEFLQTNPTHEVSTIY